MYATHSSSPQAVSSLVAAERMYGLPQGNVLLESVRWKTLAATGAELDTKRLPSKSEWTPLMEVAWKGNLPLPLASIESECTRFSRSMNVSKIPDAIRRLGLRKLLTERRPFCPSKGM